jgi:hypothetical protein
MKTLKTKFSIDFKEVEQMEPHDVLYSEDGYLTITRVWRGWIYHIVCEQDGNQVMTTTFVPRTCSI